MNLTLKYKQPAAAGSISLPSSSLQKHTFAKMELVVPLHYAAGAA
jgi:hypothetical protein